ncbi:sulfotransferase [Acidithiobacillus sp. MC6.1]|nr:sulfotransferase [Acidithiobacillus sp. MC6.1]
MVPTDQAGSPKDLWDSAHKLWAEGNKAEAIHRFRAATQQFPKHPAAWEFLGAHLLQAGNARAGGAAMARCVELEGESARSGPLAALAVSIMVDRRFGEAEPLLLRALQRADFDQLRSDILSNLSICQIEREDLNAAEKSVISALLITPRHRDALHNRGVVYERQGRYEEALNSFRGVVILDPKMRAAQKSVGLLAKKFFQWEESEIAWTNVMMMTPENHPEFEDVLWHCADVCLRQSKGLVARPLVSTLMRRNPHRKHRMLKVRLHVEEWEWKEAIAESAFFPIDTLEEKLVFATVAAQVRNQEMMVKLLDAVPECAQKLNCQWSADSPEKASVDLVSTSIRYAQNPNPGEEPGDMAALNMAIGEHQHMSRNYESAFAHFTAGHRYMAIYEPMDDEKFTGHIALIDSQKDQEVLAAEKRDDDRDLVFIVGMPRSGTTLLEQILDSHSQIHGIGESFKSNFAAQLFLHERDSILLRLRGLDYREYAKKAGAASTRVVIDKMPHNFQYVDVLARLYPEARFIWARRDPMDTCTSIFRRHFSGRHTYAHSLESLGEYYLWHEKIMREWMDRYPERIRILQYENLVDDLQGQVSDLMAWMGLNWEPECADFHRNSRAVRTASLNQVRQPLYRGARGAWRVYEPWLGPLKQALASPCGAISTQKDNPL